MPAQENTSKKTALHQQHVSLKARLVPFAGYEMPVQYAGVLEEAKAVRSAAGLFDVSHMGQVSVRGKSALSQLNKLVTNNLAKTKPGQAQYNILCQEDGGTVDDLVVYHRAEDHFYICINASNREKDVRWFKEHLDTTVSVEDESDETALIALQGPKAPTILSAFGLSDLCDHLGYYRAQEGTIVGVGCFISRTGYTGEDGFELYCPAEKAGLIWEALLEKGHAHGLVPCGLGARDTLRTEMGFPLYGHELSPTLSPIAAGLKWVVKLKKETFVGKVALEKQAQEGAPKQLKAFSLSDRRMARPGYNILAAGQVVGEVSSGVFSPHTNCPIALGFVKRGLPEATSFQIDVRGTGVDAKIATLPFVKSGAKKN